MTNEIIFFNLFDYFENNLENLDVYLTLSWSNSFLNISLNDKEKIEIYKKERQQKLKKLESFLKKNKVWYKIFDTNGDTFKELFLFFNDE
jgi:hypothetical protein